MVHAEMFAFDIPEVSRGARTKPGISFASHTAVFLLLVIAAATLLFALATRVEAFFLF